MCKESKFFQVVGGIYIANKMFLKYEYACPGQLFI